MKMDIAFASDDKYAPIMAAAIVSIQENKKPDDNIAVHILESDISLEKKNKILSLCSNEDFKIYFYDVSEYIAVIKQSGMHAFKGNYMAYARLFVGKCLDRQIRRVLYLDCDVLVQTSLEPLFQMDMHGIVAGVKDWVHMSYREKIGLTEKDVYINTGICLIDLEKWRKSNPFERACQMYRKTKLQYHYADQDFINLIFRKQIDILPLRYCVFYPMYRWERQKIIDLAGMGENNFYSVREYKEASRLPGIIHLTGTIEGQPWKKGNICRERKLWMHYFRKTGMGEETLRFRESLSMQSFLFNRILYRIVPLAFWYPLYKKRYLAHIEEQMEELEG